MEVGRAALSPASDIPHSRSTSLTSRQKWINIVILIYINFLNYADRYNLAGLLIDLQVYYDIRDDKGGLIQSVFQIFYMISAPLFGFLGDRYNRKYLLISSVLLWNVANLGASFMENFWLFLIFRALLGIGQSCFTTIAPCVISDLIVGDLRSKILTIFYMAIPVGNGIGYVIGTQMAQCFRSWEWSLRATPIIAIFNILLLLIVLKEPKRGLIEGATELRSTPWFEDIKYLLANPSFMFSTLGFTAVAFATGAVTWWAPKLNYLGFMEFDPKTDSNHEGTIFGIVSILSGFLGVLAGYLITFKFREKYPEINPLICGVGLLVSGPFLIAATYSSKSCKLLTYALFFVGLIFMNLNWAITMDICLGVVVPSRRSSAVGLQLLVGHTLGDAGSPYLTGLVSEELKTKYFYEKFPALQIAFFIGCGVEILGSLFFFLNVVYFVQDLEKMKNDMEISEQITK